ncbi:MAG: hypothetical protein ACQESP_03225 [Candidatus Muiribacteriota bacterium]
MKKFLAGFFIFILGFYFTLYSSPGVSGQNRVSQLPQSVISEFDKSGDGELSKEELKDLRNHFNNLRQKQREEIISELKEDEDFDFDRKNIFNVLRQINQSKINDFKNKYNLKDEDLKFKSDKLDEIPFEDLEPVLSIFFNRAVLSKTNNQKSNNFKNNRNRKDGFMKSRMEGFSKNRNKQCDEDCDDCDDEDKVLKRKNTSNNSGRRLNDGIFANPVVREYILMRFDKDDKGYLNIQERKDMVKEFQKVRNRYNLTSDGKISQKELQKFRNHIIEMAQTYIKTRGK